MDLNLQICGRTLAEWIVQVPILEDIGALKEVTWANPAKKPTATALAGCPLTMADIQDASDRLERFADYFQTVFPETQAYGGILESPVQAIPAMKKLLEEEAGTAIPGNLLVKLDSHLPISGSIKARGDRKSVV